MKNHRPTPGRLAWPLHLLVFILLGVAPARAQEVVQSKPALTPDLQAKAEAHVLTLRKANLLLDQGDMSGALAAVNSVLQEDSHNLAAYVLRGAIDSKQKQWAQAQADYEAAHLISPHNQVVLFNLAELQFVQKNYDLARADFSALAADHNSDIADLTAYKIFLCDLFGNHDDQAAKELAAFNNVGGNPSYYFANAAWDLVHHKSDEARSWLGSASDIYTPAKNGFYAASLFDTGYLPLKAPAPDGR